MVVGMVDFDLEDVVEDVDERDEELFNTTEDGAVVEEEWEWECRVRWVVRGGNTEEEDTNVEVELAFVPDDVDFVALRGRPVSVPLAARGNQLFAIAFQAD